MLHDHPPTLEGSNSSSSRLNSHIQILEEAYANLARATLQYGNLLCRLRGNNTKPAEVGLDNPADPPIINQLENLGGALLDEASKLNGLADELNEYI